MAIEKHFTESRRIVIHRWTRRVMLLAGVIGCVRMYVVLH